MRGIHSLKPHPQNSMPVQDQKVTQKSNLNNSLMTFAKSGVSNISNNNSVTPDPTKTFGDENFVLHDASNATSALHNLGAKSHPSTI